MESEGRRDQDGARWKIMALLTLRRGFVPLTLHLDSAAQDEIVECTLNHLLSRAKIRANVFLERLWYLFQVAIPLPDRLSYALRRPVMDLLRAQIPLPDRVQNHLHQHVRLHRLPDAQ